MSAKNDESHQPTNQPVCISEHQLLRMEQSTNVLAYMGLLEFICMGFLLVEHHCSPNNGEKNY
jgi:hypothetical protein